MAIYIPKEDRKKYKAMNPGDKRAYRADRKAKTAERTAKQMATKAGKKKVIKLEKIEKAKVPKSVKEMQSDIQAALAEHEIDPLVELLKQCKKSGKLVMKDKVAIYKFLMPYIHAQKKSIDIQADLKMNVSVTMQSFAGASKQILDAELIEVDESEYTEFTDKLIEE